MVKQDLKQTAFGSCTLVLNPPLLNALVFAMDTTLEEWPAFLSRNDRGQILFCNTFDEQQRSAALVLIYTPILLKDSLFYFLICLQGCLESMYKSILFARCMTA